MPAGSTYTPISTTTLGSTQSTVTFNSFSGYTDLVLVATPLVPGTDKDMVLQFNGDTGANYSVTILTGTGSSANSARITGQTIMYLDFNGVIQSSNQSNRIVQIMNYSNTSTYKTVLARANNAATGTDAIVGLWRSTAAITSITLIAQSGGSFAAGSTFTLYGIAAA